MNRLKELRKNSGKTQKEVFEDTGIPIRSIQNWENGKRQINSESAKKLADYFGVDIAYLLGYSYDRKKEIRDIRQIKRIREKMNLSVKELSDYLEVSESQFLKWENLEEDMPFDVGRNLADMLDKPASYFLSPKVMDNHFEKRKKQLIDSTAVIKTKSPSGKTYTAEDVINLEKNFEKVLIQMENAKSSADREIIGNKKLNSDDINFNEFIWEYFNIFRGVEFDKGFLSKERSILNDLNKIIEINEDTELSDDKKEEKISNLVNNLIRQFSLYSVFAREKIIESKNKND